MMYVAEAQAMAHIQDLGRYGLRRYGIGHAGAIDTLSLRAGNLLLGNPEGAAAVEIALGGMSVSFDRDTPFCITGAVYEAQLGGEPVYSYWRYTAHKGQTLKLIRAVQGMYGYLCVQGGFNVPQVLGSRSTDLRAGFGGFEGRCLRKGDEVPLLRRSGAQARCVGIAPPTPSHRIHALPSSEYGAFTRRSHSVLWQNAWTLQSGSNRMGYRFEGETLELAEPLEMLSHAVQFGTVQVPPGGKPIILMADAQTTGGYPKIACVAAADLGRLAQIRFGSKIFFRMIAPHEAAQLQRRNQAYLNQIKRIAENVC
ncbi:MULTISPECIES: biotin-dependent carboxyltransferase family protein [unclassified Neisseria]|uniref:5-oxoprolinase subunit C family protein n=1 Tax=unclassified Neisseria TaxID=2623750 RepID=UPI0010724F27|nr:MULTISPECIES: biotin-dependent carboxyltransferase family protein [unclassified Neisseria]MBF0803186.1 biotin-dependent carboxyltransferase family protein [Neisseria sp. 19428wB4_WF04]TFU44160.1 biotin-dependent carboxyltransferase family protein [Neisseria sp. WF04]